MTEEVTIHPNAGDLDDVAVGFLFEQVSEPEEMTDDDSNLSLWELKIKVIPRKFIQFTFIKLLFSFTFLDLGGGAYMTSRKSTISLSKLGRGAYTEGAYTWEYTVEIIAGVLTSSNF